MERSICPPRTLAGAMLLGRGVIAMNGFQRDEIGSKPVSTVLPTTFSSRKTPIPGAQSIPQVVIALRTGSVWRQSVFDLSQRGAPSH